MSYIGNQPTTVAFLTDTFSGTGSQTAFTMQVAPATTSSVLVAVTGVLQSPDTYSVVGTTLTFSAAPPSGTSNISVRYLGIPASGVTTTAYRTVTDFTATAGQTTFTVPSYTVGYIDVYRNGSRLGSADYTATSGTTVVLASAATAGDLVVTESFYVSSVLNAIAATAGSVGTTYIADSSITTAKIAAGAVAQVDLATGVAGTGPAFSAYASASQTPTTSVITKIQFNTEAFDTASCYDTSNYRFTPTVAGYYFVTVALLWSSITATTYQSILLYKNGATWKSAFGLTGSSTAQQGIYCSALVYMNGTTDYLESYMYHNGTATTNQTPAYTYFEGAMVRAA